jgi:hypothetical protein
MTKKELKNAIEYIEMFIEDFKYDCQHQKETHSALSSDDEEFKETLKILENIRNELKAQKTPKKYLTYKDVLNLCTKNSYKVKQGDCVYEMILQEGIFERNIQLYREDNLVISDLYVSDELLPVYKFRNQFFNDLHLELVEE